MTDRLDSACDRVFARHETFHPRYGWFRKAVKAAGEDAAVFNADDATVTLGVGKNMVRAIRYWTTAAKLIAPTGSTRADAGRSAPTLTGLAVFGDGGADPYMETPGTLWLLHWLMLRPSCEIPVWWLAFNRFTAVQFTERQLRDFVIEEVVRAGWQAPNESSIDKDISCLLRTYAAVTQARSGIDDILDCPMRHCGLIEQVGAGEYRFVMGRKPSLPAEIVLFAAADWMSLQQGGALSVDISRLVHEPGSPGKVLKLAEGALVAALEEGCARTGVAALSSGAGANRLMLARPPAEAAEAALNSYYGRFGYTLGGRLGSTVATEQGASA